MIGAGGAGGASDGDAPANISPFLNIARARSMMPPPPPPRAAIGGADFGAGAIVARGIIGAAPIKVIPRAYAPGTGAPFRWNMSQPAGVCTGTTRVSG